ncbi:DUF397 domain-containing protein [Yinghuangia sp. ASG 101]|uniref:DUF397 domain-containing protein n=1 Tax=Yinghuangia sp. ASG 101 TaxID=2896848 RepID=UPI001E33C60F|nr:DUF397 domain-containing protein [Yinghuangia sp. ASG 101]UGQ13577.1 DUF397 domain-containing protein [Yinghuangia sp. ASG 101]
MFRHFTHWRVSARTDGANTCVEAATDGAFVAVQNSALRHPAGPMLTVSAVDWEAFLRVVAAGRVGYDEITSATFGPFLLERDGHGSVVMRDAGAPAAEPVRFTEAEWDVFVDGVLIDGEFSMDWLRGAPEAESAARL